MKTRAPEFRALIIIFGSAGPVISTRRSSRSAGAGADRPVAVADLGGRRVEVEARAGVDRRLPVATRPGGAPRGAARTAPGGRRGTRGRPGSGSRRLPGTAGPTISIIGGSSAIGRRWPSQLTPARGGSRADAGSGDRATAREGGDRPPRPASRRTIASRKTARRRTATAPAGRPAAARSPTIGRLAASSSAPGPVASAARIRPPRIAGATPLPRVAEPVMDPPAGQRPEPRPMVVGDVDRAAPGVLDPDVGEAREPAPKAVGGASRAAPTSWVNGPPDPAAPARPAAAAAERDPAIGGRPPVVEREPCVGDALAAGPADLREPVRDRLGEDDVARPRDEPAAERPPAGRPGVRRDDDLVGLDPAAPRRELVADLDRLAGTPAPSARSRASARGSRRPARARRGAARGRARPAGRSPASGMNAPPRNTGERACAATSSAREGPPAVAPRRPPRRRRPPRARRRPGPAPR